jgi:DNA invertase Pin-like site-specific DNA recombinase
MMIGYARVSTGEQDASLQVDALKSSGCEKIFTDAASGADDDRSGLKDLLSHLRGGDTLVVWRLDRLGRSLKQLIEVVAALNTKGIAFLSLTESIDTRNAGGRLIFHVFGALAEFEREVIRSRTRAGLAAARARGRHGGRPRLMDERTIAAARAMLADPDARITDVCRTLGVSRATLYRYLQKPAGHHPTAGSTLSTDGRR